MTEENRVGFETVEEDYEFLDTVEYEGDTYFILIPATELVEIDGEEMLEGVDDGGLCDNVYNIFKENNKDEFEFLD